MKLGVYALFALAAYGTVVFAQTPDPQGNGSANQQNGDPQAAPVEQDPAQLPPSPAELQQKQIRQYDPLDKGDSSSRDKSKDNRGSREANQDGSPIPGSVAASNQTEAGLRSGPEVVEDDGTGQPVQEYTGPAVLSRSYSIDRPQIPQEIKWSESAGVSSIFDSGTYPTLKANGSQSTSPLYGTILNWSFGGRHYFRKDQIAVSYTGNVQRYSGPGAYNGANNTATVDYTHVLSRRVSLTLRGTGSMLSQNSTFTNQLAGPQTIANVNIAISPNLQILDYGMRSFSSGADIVWQKTSRLSFDGGVSYFGVSQDNAQLLGVTGQQGRGDVNYRFTRQTTLGSYYSFSNYLYPHGFGTSQINTAGLIFSHAFNKTTQLRLRGGFSHVTSLELQTVPIAPAIAALLGVSTGQIDSSQSTYGTDISAQLVKDFSSRQSASIAYVRGITPGNGVYMTSQQQTITANFTAKVFRTYSLQFAVGRDTLYSIAQYLGKYQDAYALISLNRSYRRGLGLSLSMQYRYFDIQEFSSVRNELRVTSGLSWGSGTGRLWPF